MVHGAEFSYALPEKSNFLSPFRHFNVTTMSNPIIPILVLSGYTLHRNLEEVIYLKLVLGIHPDSEYSTFLVVLIQVSANWNVWYPFYIDLHLTHVFDI